MTECPEDGSCFFLGTGEEPANLSCFEYLLGSFHAFVHGTLTPGGRHYYLHFFKDMKARDIKHPIQGHPQRATGGATSQVLVCLGLSLPPRLPMLPPCGVLTSSQTATGAHRCTMQGALRNFYNWDKEEGMTRSENEALILVLCPHPYLGP